MKKTVSTIISFLIPAIFIFLNVAEAGEVVDIRLYGGTALRGEILRERESEVILDVGFEVLRVPRAEILEIVEPEGEEAVRETIRTEDLYYEADLVESTIRDLTERFGKSVVMVSTPSGLGSGFVINHIGHVITNAHVIEGERAIDITLFLPTEDGFARERRRNVRIVAVNPFTDLALLKIDDLEGLDLEPAYFGNSDDVRQGQEVFAIGNPLGLERSVSSGVVSSADRNVEGQLFIQTTAPINPGNSGGPLFNMRGEVIGVTNMKIMWFTEGLGFAIPIRTVKDFIRNRKAFAFDETNPNTGVHYHEPPRRASAEDDE